VRKPIVYDVAILGAGLAGLSAADAVLQRKQNCVIADPSGSCGGASAAPMMLANPAAGRRAKKTWCADDCMDYLINLLGRLFSFSESPCFEKNGVLRPALTEKIARDFERSIEKYNWPDGWVEWIPEKTFQVRYPFFSEHYGGLYVKSAITLKGNVLTEIFLKHLTQQGVHHIASGCTELNRINGRWDVQFENGTQISAKHVIDATGYHHLKSGWWECLPLHPVKGQTATFHFNEPLPLNHSVSSLGYMAFISQTPDRLTVGSTYEHKFNHLQPDEEGLSYLKEKLERTLPGLVKKAVSVEQWASVRITVPDKKPVIGPHPEKPGLWFFGALGSKGLLMSRYLAELLLQAIFEGTSLPETVSIRRLL
jgi:glycine oxidase